MLVLSRSLAVSLLVSVLLLAPQGAHAGDARVPRADITITYDGEFDRAHGVRSGSGTVRDPYVISGWSLGSIEIRDTTKAVRIVNNTIADTLRLNWIGSNVLVRNNDIGDLRVNENNARWGDPTTGVIERNTFDVVGQLRHFDGRFAHNTVGNGGLPEVRAVNFDGFNGAMFAHNTIYGYVDARLHGHHHSSSFGEHSHMHATSPHDAEVVDHAKRWHEVMIHHNEIFTNNPYALAYLDTNHADNDRTANSETNPWLNAPHVHHTRVHITGNRLVGGGLLVDVFNASDERHIRTARGRMHIEGNRISLEHGPLQPFQVGYGIEVREARDVALGIMDNVITAPAPLADLPFVRTLQTRGAGIFLRDIDDAMVRIEGGRVTNRQYGVQAARLTSSVEWVVEDVTMRGVEEPVHYDGSVRNAPARD